MRLVKSLPAPVFVEVVPERDTRAALVVRVGVVEIEVGAGCAARLSRDVVEALEGEP